MLTKIFFYIFEFDFISINDLIWLVSKIFNHNGVLVHTLGSSGTLRRHFRSPEVVAVDGRGNIIVGDSGNARVQIFSPQGDLLRVLGGRSSKSNKFGWISGLLVKNNLDLLIGDNKNNTIKMFNSQIVCHDQWPNSRFSLMKWKIKSLWFFFWIRVRIPDEYEFCHNSQNRSA